MTCKINDPVVAVSKSSVPRLQDMLIELVERISAVKELVSKTRTAPSCALAVPAMSLSEVCIVSIASQSCSHSLTEIDRSPNKTGALSFSSVTCTVRIPVSEFDPSDTDMVRE